MYLKSKLKSFINDKGIKAIIGISEKWLTLNDKMSSWNVAPKTDFFSDATEVQLTVRRKVEE